MTTTQLMERLTRARVQLVLDHCFFGSLSVKLTNEFDPAIPTACTNGQRIRWNPTFLEGLSDAEVAGVMIHEILHVANGHQWRRDGREMGNWNIACDIAINPIVEAEHMTLPKGAIMPDPSQVNQAAEAIYATLPPSLDGTKGQPGGGDGAEGNDSTENGNVVGNDPGGCGEVEDAPGGPEGAQEQKQEWEVAVAQAAAAAKSQGLLPAHIQRLVDSILDPKIPWSVMLRDFVERTARNDYNWAVPNRRYLQSGIILPSLVSEELPAIVIAVDTSGSIGQAELDAFASEVTGVLGAYETTIHIVYCDAAVAHTETLTRADLPIKLKPHGGGGTDFRPVFEWVSKQGLTPAALVYLTDGYGTFPAKAADYPTMWVMTTDQKAPAHLGQTVRMQ